MKGNMKRSTILLLSLCAIAALVYGCAANYEDQSGLAGSEAAKAFTVKTGIAKKQTIERTMEYTSTLLPFEEVHFSPASPGRIQKLNVNVGDRVAKGQLIAVMDQTQLNQARVQLSNLETDFERLEALIKTGSIPQQQYDQVKTQYEVAKSNYEFLQQNTQLKAPFNGMISGKYYEEGEMYSGAPNSPAGKAAIVSIVQIHPIKAVINVSERHFPVIKKGMTAEVKTDIYPGERFEAEIVRIHPVIDQSTRTFQVELKISNAGEKLRPGMFARIYLHMGEAEALMVPSIAVLKQTGSNNRFVYIRQNDVAVIRFVSVGDIVDDYIEVVDGLKAGEELVVVGQNKISDQAKIEVVQ